MNQIKNEYLTEEDLELRNHVLKSCKPDGVPTDLDLSDDKHYKFLLNERGGSEYLKSHFPQYHKKLQNSRNRAIEAKKSNTFLAPTHMTLLEKAANNVNVAAEWHDHIQITGLIAQQNTAGYQINSDGLISFVDGLQVLNATLTIANSNTGELIDQTTIPHLYDQGYDTLITSNGNTASIDGVDASLTVDYIPYDTGIIAHKVMKLALTDKIDPRSEIIVTNPVHKPGVGNVGFIKVCMGRHGSDCDYEYTAQAQPKPPTPTITVTGSVTFPDTIKDPVKYPDSLGVYFMVKRRAGGSAQLFKGYGNINNYFKVTDGKTISWTFDPAAFDKSETPWSQGNEVDLNLTVQVSVGNGIKNGHFQVTSLKPAKESKSVKKIDVLHFFWGCLSADTLITMQNNTEKRIDSISIGEMVKTGNDKCLEVIDIITGKEEKSCLRIETKSNRSLLVTDEHPISRANEFCLAKELAVGDIIKTESGLEIISNITEEQYDGTIYNLKLSESRPAADHYANGILVGDGNMQGFLLKERQRLIMMPRKIEELPEQWRFDAENAIRLREGETLLHI